MNKKVQEKIVKFKFQNAYFFMPIEFEGSVPPTTIEFSDESVRKFEINFDLETRYKSLKFLYTRMTVMIPVSPYQYTEEYYILESGVEEESGEVVAHNRIG